MCGAIPLLPQSTAWCGAKLSTSITSHYHCPGFTQNCWEAHVQTARLSDTQPTQLYVLSCSHSDIYEVFLSFENTKTSILMEVLITFPCPSRACQWHSVLY